MNQSTRTGIFVLITVYLISIFFMLSAMTESISTIDATSTSGTIGGNINFLGMQIGISDSILGNFIISVASVPIWFNTIFIVLPFTIWTIFCIMMWIPTLPSG
jgi:hypothetical protein